MTGASNRIVTLSNSAFADIAAAIERCGLIRDPDRGGVEIDGEGRPSLASWSGAEGDEREVDYRQDGMAGIAWLELRGSGAAELAGRLAAQIGARDIGTTEELLAGLMTGPSAARRHGDTANGAGRWQMLRAAVAAYGPANAMLVRSMIRAGLRDADWRVRMTAMLATGRLRLADLAPLAMTARVPEAGKAGVRQEERRMLLALRQASHDFALGLPPSTGPGEGMAAEIAARRRDFQAKLHRLLGGDDIDDVRATALFSTLLGPYPG